MKTKKLLSIVLALAFCGISAEEAGAWTWLHRKIFTEHERASNNTKNELIYRKEAEAPFTQLMFCWNALRPLQGFFSFSVQVRVANTWGQWHRMSDWGAGIQRSYFSEHDGIGKFIHVRMEITPTKKADAFAIKIQANDKASLSLLHAFTVNIADFTKFSSEIDKMPASMGPSVILDQVPTISQLVLPHEKNEVLCSPTSCSILLTYLLDYPIDPCDFAEKSFDNGLGAFGSWPFNMAHAFERSEGKISFAAMRLPSFTSLVSLLKKKIPVIVSVRGALPGAPKDYPHGHLMVVVGYDNEKNEVICHDPAGPTTLETVRRYQLNDFLKAWERSHRLAYRADPGFVGFLTDKNDKGKGLL
jgi:hypothetical protein